ncbi:hypothetical protein [Kaarinaea lacus]
MTNQQPAEEILLYSQEEEVQSAPTEESFSQVTLQLLQIQKWKQHSLALLVLENKFLYVKNYRYKRKDEYWLNLKYLNPQPKKTTHIAWRWGVAMLFCLLNAFGLWAAKPYISEWFPYSVSAMVLLLTVSAILTLIMIYRSQTILLYSTASAQIPVVSLAYNNPSKGEFRTFVKALSQIILAAQPKDYQDQSNRLAVELAEHRRLKESKVISEEQYEMAKETLFSQH